MNLNNLFERILCALLALVFFLLAAIQPAYAISDTPFRPYRIPLSQGVPDWANISFDRMGTVDGENFGIIRDPALLGQLGYNPSRAFSRGDKVSTTIKVGDLEVFGLGSRTFGSFLGGVDPNTISLGSLNALNGSSLNDLVAGIPGLANLPVGSVPLIKSIASGDGIASVNNSISLLKSISPEVNEFLAKNPWAADLPIEQLLQGDWKNAALSAGLRSVLPALIKDVPGLQQVPIGDLLGSALNGDIKGLLTNGANTLISTFLKDNPALSNLPLGVLTDINNFSIGGIPNLVNTSITSIPGLKNQIIGNVPGLTAVPLEALLGLLNIASAKIDHPDAGASAATRAFTGGGYTFKSIDCEGQCPNFEVNSARSAVPLLSNQLNGTQFVVGSLNSSKGQSTKGGRGPLQAMFGGKEPVHIRPWGDGPNIALVATDVNDETGNVAFAFYLRFCIDPPFAPKTCSPYGIGPIPFTTIHQDNWVVIQSSGQPPISNPTASGFTDECGGSTGGNGSAPPPSANPNAPIGQQNLKRYLDRIALGESNGGTDLGPNYLGAYGKYQFIPATRASILSQYGYDAWNPNQWDNAAIALMRDVGGQRLLSSIAAGDFAFADRVLNRTWTSLPGGHEESPRWNNQTTLAQYGPVGKPPDKLGGQGGGGVLLASAGNICGQPIPCEEGKTCVLLNPNPTGVVPYNGWYGAPRPGRRHLGQDLQSPKGYRNYPRGPGENIRAAGDGVVSEMTPVGGRCGGIVAIQHESPRLETRYVHMVKVFVSRSQRVKRGQFIGVEGSEIPGACSTAVHLHYEIYSGGSPIDPTRVQHEPPIPSYHG